MNNSLMITKLDWDSGLFGYNVGQIKISLNQFDEFQRMNKSEYKLIYVQTDDRSEIFKAKLIKENGIFVDRKITYFKSLLQKPQFAFTENLQFRELNAGDYHAELRNLAYLAGQHSRFRIDTNFKNNEFEQLYDIWLQKSLSKEIAFASIGLFIENKIKGFVTLGLDQSTSVKIGKIGLIAISPDVQNNGLGSALIKYAENKCIDQMCMQIQVVTQGLNAQACRFYEKNGYQVSNIIDIYHLWNTNL